MHTPVWLHEQSVTNTEWLSSLNWCHTLCLSLTADKLKLGNSDDENVLCTVPQLLQSFWLFINQSKVVFSHKCKPKRGPNVLLEHYSVIRKCPGICIRFWGKIKMWEMWEMWSGVDKYRLNSICVIHLWFVHGSLNVLWITFMTHKQTNRLQ